MNFQSLQELERVPISWIRSQSPKRLSKLFKTTKTIRKQLALGQTQVPRKGNLSFAWFFLLERTWFLLCHLFLSSGTIL